MTVYRVFLRFREGGPAVTGDWASEGPALRTYRDWIGLYGTSPATTIELTAETDGVQRALRRWTAAGEQSLRADGALPQN